MSRYLTLEEVAVSARCGSQKVRKAIKSGALKASLEGKRFLVAEADMRAWVERRPAAVTPSA
jgi:excisionase family DNA binding protein